MWVTVNWLAEVTGKHPATIKKRTAALDCNKDGKFDSKIALQAIYIGVSGDKVTTEEAIRQLNVARKQEIDLGMEVTRKDRIPIEDCLAVNDEIFQAIAGILKSNRDRQLTDSHINEILDSLREVPDKIPK
jgi:hypothetical protein